MSYNSLLINTCVVLTVGVDKWNEPTETATAGVKCRIEYANRIIRNFRGEEVLSAARVFFKANVVLTEADRLQFGGRNHGIQRIDWPQNSVAIHHVEVWVD